MSVYSVDKLIVEARRLAREFYRATGKPLPGVSAELALYDAIHYLGLTAVENSEARGYDAVGNGKNSNLKYQIKGRVIFDDQKSGQRVGQLRMDQNWDRVVLVLMDDGFDATDIYQAERHDIEQAMLDSQSSSRKHRGALSVAKFKMISDLVWTREQGLMADDVWSNSGK